MSDTEHSGNFEVVRVNLFYLVVCSELSADKIEEEVRSYYSCGTTKGWTLCEEEGRAPVECSEKPGRTHYMFAA